MKKPDSQFHARVLTLFPEMFPGLLGCSLVGNALKKGLWTLDIIDIRNFATDVHATVDDTPFGGGCGMVIRPDVVNSAIESIGDCSRPVIYLSPRGQRFTQKVARELSASGGVTFLCGRYEGVDQRVVDKWQMMELSIGDFILSGGEPAVQVILDSVIRLLPNVLGNVNSLRDESFEQGLLEYSHYTRPRIWEGRSVPEVLLSGHHADISAWRMQEKQRITREKRPDMWNDYIKDGN